MDEYYGLPLKFSDIFKKKELRQVSEFDSIGFNVRLILRSHYGENRFDYSYGCEVWERDFEVIENSSKWSEELSKSIRETLLKHEKRMQNTKVIVRISEEEFKADDKEESFFRVKRKIEVKIKYNYHLTGQEYELTEKLYISPLSIEEAQ